MRFSRTWEPTRGGMSSATSDRPTACLAQSKTPTPQPPTAARARCSLTDFQGQMMRRTVCLCWIAQFVFVSGCGPNVESDQERLKRLVPNAAQTTKVSGKVTVDG